MSRHVSELCALLVDDVYGELTSLLFRILLRYGRLSVPALRHHTCLSERLIKHGLSVLVQHQLVLWYTSVNESTIYEANTSSAYPLVRSGKYIKIAEDQVGKFAGEVISCLLGLGHAQVGDLLEGFGVGRKKNASDPLGVSHESKDAHTNGLKHAANGVRDSSVTFELIQGTLCDLLRAGLISEVHESHFRSETDNRLEAEKLVPPVQHYKAKSKREGDAQWEASIKMKLAEWKYGAENEAIDFDSPMKGKKRPLDDPDEYQPKKRPHPSSTPRLNGRTGAVHELAAGGKGFLNEKTTLRINHAKFAVILRNNYLVELASRSICSSTSVVYAELFRAILPRLRECREEQDTSDEPDTKPDLSNKPQISTDEVAFTITDSAELANALGKVDTSRLDLTSNEHRKRRRKKEAESEDEVMVDGDASSDEDEDGFSNENESNISSDSDRFDGQADYDPESLPSFTAHNTHRETIRDHLLLLARHPFEFLHHFPQTAVLPERWTVDYAALMENVLHHTLMQNITSRHGTLATRITRILLENGKVGEKELCSISLVKQQTLRSYLAALHLAGVIHVQEIPRDHSRNLQRSLFLWFFDVERYKAKMLEDLYKAMARFLQRARTEGDKVKATREKANRTDVIGKEEQFLGIHEREALDKWRGVEERIWGELGRLDDLVGVIRDY